MNNINNNNKKSVGFKGERCVIDKLKTIGFELYKKNVKGINFEIDIVAYKYNSLKHTLDIRIIEVKTRNKYQSDLLDFNIYKKWRLIKPYIFIIKSEIDAKFDVLKYSEVHFDLALVTYKDDFYFMHSYLKDINLML